MCGTKRYFYKGRDSTYVYKTLVKAIELASTKGTVIIGLETQIDSDMDGLDLVVREVNEQLKAYAEAHNIKVIDFYTTLFEADQNWTNCLCRRSTSQRAWLSINGV